MEYTSFYYTRSSYSPNEKIIILDLDLLIPKKIFNEIYNILKIVTLINNITLKFLTKEKILNEPITENYLIIGDRKLYESLVLNFISFDFLSVVPVNEQIEDFFGKNILNKFTNILFRKCKLSSGLFFRIKKVFYAISNKNIKIKGSIVYSRKAIYTKPDEKIIVSLLPQEIYKAVQNIGYYKLPQILINYLFVLTSHKMYSCTSSNGYRCSITGLSHKCLFKNNNKLILPVKILDNKLIDINDGFINERLFIHSSSLGFNDKIYNWKSNDELVLYLLSNKLSEFRIYLLNEIYQENKNNLLQKLFSSSKEELIVEMVVNYYKNMKANEMNNLLISSFDISKYFIDSLNFIKDCFKQYESIIILNEKIKNIKDSLEDDDFKFNESYEKEIIGTLLSNSKAIKIIKNLQKINSTYYFDIDFVFYLLSFRLNIKAKRTYLVNYLLNFTNNQFNNKRRDTRVIKNYK